VQVDSAVELVGAWLPGQLAVEAAHAAELLLRLSPYPFGPPRLTAYRRNSSALRPRAPGAAARAPRPGHRPRPAIRCRAGPRSRWRPGWAATSCCAGSRSRPHAKHDNILHLDEDLLAQLATWKTRGQPGPVIAGHLAVRRGCFSPSGRRGDFLAVVGPTWARRRRAGPGPVRRPAGGTRARRPPGAGRARCDRGLPGCPRRTDLSAPPRPDGHIMVRPVVHAREIPFDVTPSRGARRAVPPSVTSSSASRRDGCASSAPPGRGGHRRARTHAQRASCSPISRFLGDVAPRSAVVRVQFHSF